VCDSSFMRFLDHTQRRTTFGRTALDEWPARRRDLYLTTTHNTHIRAPGGIRTQNPSRRAAADLRLRPRGHWDLRKTSLDSETYHSLSKCSSREVAFVTKSPSRKSAGWWITNICFDSWTTVGQLALTWHKRKLSTNRRFKLNWHSPREAWIINCVRR